MIIVQTVHQLALACNRRLSLIRIFSDMRTRPENGVTEQIPEYLQMRIAAGCRSVASHAGLWCRPGHTSCDGMQ